jgi:hypothetical protein
MASPRVELTQIRRHLGWYQQQHGEVVLWYELDGKASVYDDVFNARHKVYRDPVAVPTLWVIYTEDTQESSPEGIRHTPSLQFALSMWEFRRVGISDPYDFERHLNDLIVYYGEYFSIGEFSPQGRLWRDDVIIGVNAIKVFPEEELVDSEIPDSDTVAEAKRPSLGVNEDNVGTWLYYPPPAEQALATGTVTGGSYSWVKTP